MSLDAQDENRDIHISLDRLGTYLHEQGAPDDIREALCNLAYQVSFYKTRMESAHDLITRMAIALQLMTPGLSGTIVTTVLKLARLGSRRSASFNRENLN